MAIVVNQSLSVVSTSVDNTAVVRYVVTCAMSGESYNGYDQTGTFVIDGVSYSSTYRLPKNTTTTVFSKDVTIGNASERTISASYSFPTTPSGGTKTGNTSVVVPFIPRYANFTEHYVASVGTNSISVHWAADSECDSVQYSLNGGSWTGTSGNTYTINNLSPNTSYNIKTRIRRRASGLWTESGYLYATTVQKTPVITKFQNSSKTVNSITCNFTCDYAHTFYYRINNGNWTQGGNNVTSGSFSFSNLSPNTQYKIDLLCRNWINQGQGTYKESSSIIYVTTNQIAVVSSNNFNLGDSVGITFTNPNDGSSLGVGIWLTDGMTALTGDYRSVSGTNYTFNFNDAELDNIYKRFGNSNSLTVRFYIKTTCNGISYLHHSEKVCTLTGNQKTIHIGNNRAKIFMGVNGVVKRAVVWIGNNGNKRCI